MSNVIGYREDRKELWYAMLNAREGQRLFKHNPKFLDMYNDHYQTYLNRYKET